MLNRLNEACKAYEMEINVQKTNVMLMNRAGKPKGMQRCIMLDKVPLEQVTRFKYRIYSWITTKNARSDEDVNARVGMVKVSFWQNKDFLRRNMRITAV